MTLRSLWKDLNFKSQQCAITRRTPLIEDLIIRIIIQGAVTGAIYGLLALGFTLIYGVARVVNMAHGALFMLGAYVFFAFGPSGPFFGPSGVFQLNLSFQILLILAIILATIILGIIGIIIYRLTIHPVIGDVLAAIVVTVGVALIVQQLVLIIFGLTVKPLPAFVEGWVTWGGAFVTYSRLLALTVSLVLFAVVLIFIRITKIGSAMRAVAQDREVAMLMGVNTTRLYMLTVAISTSLAALAAIMIVSSTTFSAEPFMWTQPLISSFAIVILGGLGSIKGSLVGAFIIGYVETGVANLVPESGYLVGAFSLGIMLAIILLRPKGLFGKRIELE